MSEDPTQDLPPQDLTADEMLRLVLADVRDMKTRFGPIEATVVGMDYKVLAMDSSLIALGALVEDRFKDARLTWLAINESTERMRTRMDRMEEALILLREQVGRLAHRELERDAIQSLLSSRVTELENRAREGERKSGS